MHVEFESVTQKHLHTKFSVATPQRYRSQLDHGTGSLQHHELGNYIELDAARRACGVLQRDQLHHLRERRLTRHFNYHQLQRNRPVARDKV